MFIMTSKGGLLLIAISIVIHLPFDYDVASVLVYMNTPLKGAIVLDVSVGASLLFFPVFGLIADVYLTRYKMIQFSLLMLVFVLIVGLTCGMAIVLVFPHILNEYLSMLSGSLLVFGGITSIGIFEANALQFGMDQLLEMSSAQLSAFVHWYVWAMHLGQQLMFMVEFASSLLIISPPFHKLTLAYTRLLGITLAVIIGVLFMSTLVVCSYCLRQAKRHMYIAKAGMNPFRLIQRVLSFAWKNKYPLNRSSFTYCEENTPSRLDLGKKQYGGPFTTEEVEDVKTFFRLILLLGTLFGYHVSGDGLAISHYIQKYSCPGSSILGVVAYNPAFISSLVILLGIPLIKCLPKVHRIVPNMLKRMGLGLSVLVAQDIIYSVIVAFAVDMKSAGYPIDDSNGMYIMYCYGHLLHENKGHYSSNHIYLWLIVPQVLNGLGHLLVHMTTLEFICAQAPRSMQGLVIGLWYAMFSIRYALVNPLDHVFSSQLGTLFYQATRCCLVLLSLVLYMCVSRHYQYRVRDWVVHVQWMVEDVIDRRIKQEEHYWRGKVDEQQILSDSSSSEEDEMDPFMG